MKPKISVIVPCYNHAAFVETLVKSIYNQTFKNFEVIILDDGSTDSSPEVLQKLASEYCFKLILKQNEGVCKTLNAGIRLSQGDYITAIASDDFMPVTRLEEQLRYLEKNQDVDIVAGAVTLVDINGKPRGERRPAITGNLTLAAMLKTNRILAPTVMMRRTVFDRFGMYREDHLLEDYYMWIKVLKNGGVIHNLTNIWAFYRITNENLEKKFNWYFKGAEQVFQEYKAEPMIAEQITTNRFVFCVKMALLLGTGFLSKYSSQYNELSLFHKMIARATSFLPGKMRDLALLKLKLKT